MIPLLFRLTFVLLIVFSVSPVAFAAVGSPGTSPGQTVVSPGVSPGSGQNVTLQNPLGNETTLNSFVTSILSIITDIIGPVIVIFMLVYVGFLFVVARGEPGKISEARTALMWTVVGALVLLGAKVIAIAIQSTVQALSTGQ